MQDIRDERGQQFAHFKVLKYILRIIPEGFAHPALVEVAKNNDRSVPTAFKSYHIGNTVPTQNEQGVTPYGIFHNQLYTKVYA